MPVLVQNERPGPVVFTDEMSKVSIEWQGKGHPAGEDLQYVPDSIVVENVNFLKAINRGIFAVVEASDETKERLGKQAEAYRAREARIQQGAAASIDADQDKPLAIVVIEEDGKVVEKPVEVTMSPREYEG